MNIRPHAQFNPALYDTGNTTNAQNELVNGGCDGQGGGINGCGGGGGCGGCGGGGGGS